jgi:hypothetical protein
MLCSTFLGTARKGEKMSNHANATNPIKERKKISKKDS